MLKKAERSAIRAIYGVYQNQIFHYTHCIMSKRVTSRWAHFLVIAPDNTAPFEEMLQQ